MSQGRLRPVSRLSVCAAAGILLLAVAATVPARGVLAPAAAPAGELVAGVMPRAQSEVAATGPFGEFRRYFTGETRSLKDLLTGAAVIQPGQEIHPPHQHAEEELLFLTKGEGTWHLDGKEFPAHEGDVLYTAPWSVHGLKNTGKEPLTFYVVKWNGRQLPVPEKPAAGK